MIIKCDQCGKDVVVPSNYPITNVVCVNCRLKKKEDV